MTKYGDPFPYFKFSAKPPLYQPDAIEGIDYVRCLECVAYGWDFRFSRLISHLKVVHKMDEGAYNQKHPGAPVRLRKTLERRMSTVRAVYGVDNVFQAPEVQKRILATHVLRYGVNNPMQCETIHKKAELTNLARYGARNPFASPLIQERIRTTNLQRYGVPYPNQAPSVLEKRWQTNMSRYGVGHIFQTSSFRTKQAESYIHNFQTTHPMKSERGRQLWRDGCLKAFGAPNPFLVPELYAKAQNTTRTRHGGRHHLSDPSVIAARKKRLTEIYGVDNVSKIPYVKEKIIRVLKSIWGCGAVPKMNRLERLAASLLPDNVVYSGDWAYWTTWANGRHKNPDFVVLTPEQLRAHQEGAPLQDLRTYMVIEINGDFWHTAHKGTTREQRERDFIEGYLSVGIRCLVLWETDLLDQPEDVAARVKLFLSPRQ